MRSLIGLTIGLAATLVLSACGGGSVGGGQSCPTGQISCTVGADATCVDPLSDRIFCGADAACQGATPCGTGQVCANGHCATSCPTDRVNCNGTCIDPKTDETYCNADATCHGYTTCAAGHVCNDGQCALNCPTGRVNCNDTCIDPTTDNTYCNADSSCHGYTTCAADHHCDGGTCVLTCPAGRVNCSGICIDPESNHDHCGADATCQVYAACTAGQVCRNSACHPGWEWYPAVPPVTTPPYFPETSSVLAHVVFDGSTMTDTTGHTQWVAQGTPASTAVGMWTPGQAYAGPFTSSSFWKGTDASRQYLQDHTAGNFTVCARYKPGALPGMDPNKILVSLGLPEAAARLSNEQLGGWALMQMHEAACFHYYSGTNGEWMTFSVWPQPFDSATVASLDWSWQCGGWDGTTILGLRDPGISGAPMKWPEGTGGSPVAGFPTASLEPPAIGNYPNGAGPLSDGGVYEVVITSDPATDTNMRNLVARASNGLRILDTEATVPVVGADGNTYLAPSGTVVVEGDGSVLAEEKILLGAVLPSGTDSLAQGQCWGVDLSSTDWSQAAPNGALLRWDPASTGNGTAVYWDSTLTCFGTLAQGILEPRTCRAWGPLAAGHHAFQYCIDPDPLRTARIYRDGAEITDDANPPQALATDGIAHLEDRSSTFWLGPVSSGIEVWRVWACAGSDPASCP